MPKLKPGDPDYRPASGKPGKLVPGHPDYRPASGIPAVGSAPTGGKGPGWGNDLEKSMKRRSMVEAKTPEAKKRLKEYRAARLEDILMNVAEKSQFEHSKILAATRLHAIYEGTPVARNLNVNVTETSRMSDDELRDELERISREEAGTIEGTAVEVMPPKHGSVVRRSAKGR